VYAKAALRDTASHAKGNGGAIRIQHEPGKRKRRDYGVPNS
jgi:hypothetical protein